MTTAVVALSVSEAKAPFSTETIQRREVGVNDVRIDISHAGICHSDIHQARNEWGFASYPMTPGHEIVGTVAETGSAVTNVKVGDVVGVGCFVDACLDCEPCRDGEEQFCDKGVVETYNSKGYDGETTMGGYSQQVVVRDHFVLHIPDSLDPAEATPLLCAGITTYAPLKRFGVGPGKKVAVIGLGGLGHVAVKIAAAMGAEVTVLSRTDGKKDDGLAFGAHQYFATEDRQVFEDLSSHFDVILNTVGSSIALDDYFQLLDRGGTMVNVGAPGEEQAFNIFSIIVKRRNYAGSQVGGIAETQEMLDFCAEHGIGATVELIKADAVDEYYDKVVAGDVRYRAVIDTSTLSAS